MVLYQLLLDIRVHKYNYKFIHFAENLYRSGSGSVLFLKSGPDPYPVKNRPEPQHCIAFCGQLFRSFDFVIIKNCSQTGHVNISLVRLSGYLYKPALKPYF
jgi:hypothetical protein